MSNHVTVPVQYIRDLIEATSDTRDLLDGGITVRTVSQLRKRLDKIEDFEVKRLDREAKREIGLFDVPAKKGGR